VYVWVWVNVVHAALMILSLFAILTQPVCPPTYIC